MAMVPNERRSHCQTRKRRRREEKVAIMVMIEKRDKFEMLIVDDEDGKLEKSDELIIFSQLT